MILPKHKTVMPSIMIGSFGSVVGTKVACFFTIVCWIFSFFLSGLFMDVSDEEFFRFLMYGLGGCCMIKVSITDGSYSKSFRAKNSLSCLTTSIIFCVSEITSTKEEFSWINKLAFVSFFLSIWESTYNNEVFDGFFDFSNFSIIVLHVFNFIWLPNTR